MAISRAAWGVALFKLATMDELVREGEREREREREREEALRVMLVFGREKKRGDG